MDEKIETPLLDEGMALKELSKTHNVTMLENEANILDSKKDLHDKLSTVGAGPNESSEQPSKRLRTSSSLSPSSSSDSLLICSLCEGSYSGFALACTKHHACCKDCAAQYVLKTWSERSLPAPPLPLITCFECHEPYEDLNVIRAISHDDKAFACFDERRKEYQKQITIEELSSKLEKENAATKEKLLLEAKLSGLMQDPRMCPKCNYGPVEKRTAQDCDNLLQHQGELRDGKTRYNNTCPSCGFFSALYSDWMRWDGVLRYIDKGGAVAAESIQHPPPRSIFRRHGTTRQRDGFGWAVDFYQGLRDGDPTITRVETRRALGILATRRRTTTSAILSEYARPERSADLIREARAVVLELRLEQTHPPLTQPILFPANPLNPPQFRLPLSTNMPPTPLFGNNNHPSFASMPGPSPGGVNQSHSDWPFAPIELPSPPPFARRQDDAGLGTPFSFGLVPLDEYSMEYGYVAFPTAAEDFSDVDADSTVVEEQNNQEATTAADVLMTSTQPPPSS